MPPASLPHQVLVQTPTTSRTANGEEVAVWQTLGSRRCKIEPLAGRELWQAQQVQPDVTHQVWMRHYEGLTAAHRLASFGGYKPGRVLHLEAPVNEDERGHWHRLSCREPALGPIAADLVAYWAFQEQAAADGAADWWDAGATLAATGGPTVAAGKLTSARAVDGTTQYFSRASDSATARGDTTFTFAGWVYLGSLAGGTVLTKRAANTPRDYDLSLRGDNYKPVWEVYDGVNPTQIGVVTNSVALATGWSYLAVYHDADANEVGVSLNAAAYQTAATTGAAGNSSQAFAMGAISGGTGGLACRLNGWGLWARKLAIGEVRLLYNAGYGLEFPFL